MIDLMPIFWWILATYAVFIVVEVGIKSLVRHLESIREHLRVRNVLIERAAQPTRQKKYEYFAAWYTETDLQSNIDALGQQGYKIESISPLGERHDEPAFHILASKEIT